MRIPTLSRPRLRTGLALAALLALAAAVPAVTRAPAGSVDAPAPDPSTLSRLPLRFESNRGQTAGDVDYLVRGAGYTAFLSKGRSVLRLAGGTELRMDLAGANPSPEPTAGGQLAGVTNYLRGDDPDRWLTGVPSFDAVRYEAVYPGIDLVYHGSRRVLEYDFVVAPGADPGRISLDFEPASGLSIGTAGDLVVQTPAGEVRHGQPVAFQDIAGRRQPVAVEYSIHAGQVGFRLGRYDRSVPLVIDPTVVYSTLLGGLGNDTANGVATDGAGNAYLTGQAASADFPRTSPYQNSRRGATDAFVTKLNPAGTAIIYSTYFGGDDAESGNAIVVDGAGNAYVTGSTASNNLPTAGPFQGTKGTGTTTDAFVTKLDPSGTALAYSTYLGGGAADTGRGIAVDGAGNAYLTGDTASTNFPLAGALQGTKSNGIDAFVTKLNAAGSGLAYSTYLGGTGGNDLGRAIAVDGAGNAYAAGDTDSANFPTASALRSTLSGTSDAFVSKLNAAGSGLAYSTYLGGGGVDNGRGIAVDGAGSAYVAGLTASDDFPTANAFLGSRPGGDDAFVTKLDAAGTGLAYSTFLGGIGPDQANGIAVDATGSAHVVGTTSSTDFPAVTPVAVRSGASDAFFTQVNPAGNALLHSAPFGAAAADSGLAVAVNAGGGAVFVGQSAIFNDQDFPSVVPLQPVSGGANDAFVARVTPTPAGSPLVTGIAPRSGPAGTAVVIRGAGFTQVEAVRFGATQATTFTVVSPTEIRAVAPGNSASVTTITVVAAGGTSPANPITRYTYAEGTWELTGAQVQARVATRSVLMANGKVLLVGGRDRQGGAALTTAEVYDPKTGTWSATGSMATARTAHTATLLPNGKVLVTGGATGNVTTNAQPQLDSAELYDPATGTFSPTGSMAVRRYLHTAILLRNGKVLVTGGRTCNAPPPTACDFTQFTNTAELYDPATGTFSATGAMSVPRHTTDATMLTDGRILVPAGFGGPGTGWDTADVYNPDAGTWAGAGNLSIGRSRQGAVTLPDGKAIVASGFSGAATAELYNPATNSWSLTGPPNSTTRNNHFFGLLPNGLAILAGGGPGGTTAELFDHTTGRWRSAGTMNVSRGIAGTPYNTVKPVVLSSHPDRLEADPAICGDNCGKVLFAGESEDRRAELYSPVPVVTGKGYWLVASDGGIFAFGGSAFYGSTGGMRLNQPIVGMAATPSGKGYWLVASDGGIFAFGDAGFHGSTGSMRLNRPIVGMAATPSGKGYWLVASDGGIFAFGDATFRGSTGSLRLNSPVVGMASTSQGGGYWLVAADGGIFAFGDAAFFGSTGSLRLNRPIVGLTRTFTSKGYALVASDGGVFTFGDAVFRGSTGALRINQPVTGLAATPSNGPFGGYWLVATDGGIFAFGDAPFLGSTGNLRLNRPVVGMAAADFE